MSDKTLVKDVIGELDSILICVIDEQSETKQRQFLATLFAILARFNMARVYDESDLEKIWTELRQNKNTLVLIERITMQWRLSAFDEDKDVDRLVALIATSLTENKREGTVIDSAYLESIPSHGDLETLYRANFWYVMLYVSAMCPNFKRLMAEISKAAK